MIRRPSSASFDYHSATVARDLEFFLCGENLNLVCGEAKKFEAAGSQGSNIITVFSDAASEDEKIHTTEKGNVRADYLAYSNAKNIQREGGARVVGANALLQHLYVTLPARESEKATLMIEQIFQFVVAELLIAQEVEKNARIEIARARAHRDAAGGREAHGGVDRYSIAKSAEARSVTEMREDGTFGKALAEVMHQRFIGEAMESVALNTRVKVALGKRQVRCYFRDGAVKGIVEAGKVDRRWKDRLRGGDEHQRLRDVQRREMCVGTKLVQNLRRNGLVGAEFGPSVYHAMAYGNWS